MRTHSVYCVSSVRSDKGFRQGSTSTSVHARDGNKLLFKRMTRSIAMTEQIQLRSKIRQYISWKQSLALKTSSRAIIRVLKARTLAKQFSELRSSRCFIMLGDDFSRESTGTPRANLFSGVFTSTWFTQLWYREPRYTSRMNRAMNIDFLRSLLGYRC